MNWVAPTIILVIFTIIEIIGITFMLLSRSEMEVNDQNKKIIIGISLCLGGIIFAMLSSIYAVYDETM